MKRFFIYPMYLIVSLLIVLTTGCDKEEHPEYPINISGAKIEFTITSCTGCGMQPGHKVIYEFGSSGQIRGHNTQDNKTINVDSYTYSRASNKRTASARLNYHGGAATEDYDLTSNDDNWMEGTYSYAAQTPTVHATAQGTYRVICSNCVSIGSGTGGTGGTGGDNNQTGRISFFTKTDFGCGNITINVQNESAKTLSQYHPDGISNCDAQGTATYTLAPGEYSYSASCESITWGPSTFSISSNSCLRFELN